MSQLPVVRVVLLMALMANAACKGNGPVASGMPDGSTAGTGSTGGSGATSGGTSTGGSTGGTPDPNTPSPGDSNGVRGCPPGPFATPMPANPNVLAAPTADTFEGPVWVARGGYLLYSTWNNEA